MDRDVTLDLGECVRETETHALDDIVVVAIALRYAARRIPPEALIDAWPAERRILERLAPTTAAHTMDHTIRGDLGEQFVPREADRDTT